MVVLLASINCEDDWIYFFEVSGKYREASLRTLVLPSHICQYPGLHITTISQSFWNSRQEGFETSLIYFDGEINFR